MEKRLRVARNINTQERLVFRHSNKPHVFYNVSDYSIMRIERLAKAKQTERYINPFGQTVIANWYLF